ncbi:MAG: hypothetical protein ABI992_10565 [Chthoniobacterales bacterium]
MAVYVALKPLSEGLFDTSMWTAKILAPVDSEDNASTKQFLKIGQAALMEGWLSNIPIISTIAFFSAIAFGFFCKWWMSIVVYFVAVTLGVLAKLLFTRPVSHYLPLLHHKMLNRQIDYRKSNDIERAEAAESYCLDLAELICIYQDSSIRPPSAKQLLQIPYGDRYYWLEQAAAHNA